MRGIAQAAGVDPALLHHHFGNKEQLFATALETAFAPALALPEIVAGGADGLGERLVRFFLGLWEVPEARVRLVAILRSAFTEEHAAAMLREFVTRELMMRVAAMVDLPEPRLRAEVAASHLVGLAILRYIVKIEPMASADPEELVRLVAPSVQRCLTEP
jgi:AcrR family transcriptional regulator